MSRPTEEAVVLKVVQRPPVWDAVRWNVPDAAGRARPAAECPHPGLRPGRPGEYATFLMEHPRAGKVWDESEVAFTNDIFPIPVEPGHWLVTGHDRVLRLPDALFHQLYRPVNERGE